MGAGGGFGLASCLAPAWLQPLEPKGATLEAETSHYAAASAAAGISGLNSSADWGALDCIFYRITIERPYIEQSQRRLALLNKI